MGKVLNRELRAVILSDDVSSPDNSANEMLFRGEGLHICKELTITTSGSQVVNALQLVGTVRVTNQWAIITDATDITTFDTLYADLYDGTNAVDLTLAAGLDLSNAPLGTFFTKDKISTSAYSANLADQCRMLETLEDKKSGRPFIITQKVATNTYVRFHYNTGAATINCKIKIHFEYIPINGSTLAFL